MASWLATFCGVVTNSSPGGEERRLEPPEVSREFSQRTWRREDGLPPGERVHSILQTRDGYLWVGSQYGLARFDGRSFVVYDHVNTPELSSGDCRSLAEDAEGDLWVGTQTGLLRKRGNQFRDFAGMLGADFVSYPALAASRRGGVWVGGRGIVTWLAGDQMERYRAPEADPCWLGLITALDEDPQGILWICTESGFGRLEVGSKQFEAVSPQSVLRGLPAVGMWTAPTGRRWVILNDESNEARGTERLGWLTYIDPGEWPNGPRVEATWPRWGRRFLAGDSQGVLWLPSRIGGIARYRNGKPEFLPLPEESRSDFVLSAYCDREGSLWVGTDMTGLQRWTPRKFRAYRPADGLAHENTWSIIEARKGGVWVGTEGGVTRIEAERLTTLVGQDGLPHRYVRALAEDAQGGLWIGTMRGLEYVHDGVTKEMDLPGDWFESKIRALFPSRDGSLWVGTVMGLTRLEEGKRTKFTTEDGLGSNEIRAILETRLGDLWVGTMGGGLSRFHGGGFTTLRATNGLSSDNVWALLEDAEGRLWVGTDNGLNLVAEGRVMRITPEDGLPEGLVNSLVEDDLGRMWVGHDRGVYFVERRQLLEFTSGRRKQVEAIEYDESDGLPSAETNGQKSYPSACRTRDGRLWFPTTQGVALLDPKSVGSERLPPLAAIGSVRANGQLVFGNLPGHPRLPGPGPVSAVLELPPGGARVLEFSYTATTLVAPEKSRFKYRLGGLDDSWIEAGTRRQAYFTDLGPGHYRFELMARNHHGVWQDRSVTLAFHVAPFFYQTWWFYTLCGGAAAVCTGLVVRWRVKESRRIFELERVNALNEQRRQIARDIHDELGASLTHIIQINERMRANPHPASVDADTQRIAAIAGEAVDNIGEIVWANNPEYDTLEDLVAYVREHAASFLSDTPLRVTFDFPADVPERPVSGLFRRHVVLLVKESLQNVVKHARAKHVHLSLTVDQDRIRLLVSDDGAGFVAEVSPGPGNGLKNMRQRISELGGEIEIESRPGAGTRVMVRAPLSSV